MADPEDNITLKQGVLLFGGIFAFFGVLYLISTLNNPVGDKVLQSVGYLVIGLAWLSVLFRTLVQPRQMLPMLGGFAMIHLPSNSAMVRSHNLETVFIAFGALLIAWSVVDAHLCRRRKRKQLASES